MVSKNTGVSMAMNTQDHETTIANSQDLLYGVASDNLLYRTVQSQAIFASKPSREFGYNIRLYNEKGQLRALYQAGQRYFDSGTFKDQLKLFIENCCSGYSGNPPTRYYFHLQETTYDHHAALMLVFGGPSVVAPFDSIHGLDVPSTNSVISARDVWIGMSDFSTGNPLPTAF